MPISLTCERCGKTFERKASQAARSRHAYCSRACHYKPVPSEDELRAAYANQTAADVAKVYGVDRSAVASWLDRYGIPRRTISESKALQTGRLTYEERLAATAASRLVINAPGGKPHDWLVKRALGVQRAGRMSPYEATVFTWAAQFLGYMPVAQYAIDKYNVDIAIPACRIAIEVQGGLWHTRHSPRKTAQDEAKRAVLKLAGWTVIYIQARDRPTLARNLAWLQEVLAPYRRLPDSHPQRVEVHASRLD
jgi:very-short-patch-repair endonuclease